MSNETIAKLTFLISYSNMETEITCGTVENNTNENSSVNKRKRSQNRVWIKIKEFANSKDAENHLELENCWRKASSKKNVLGKRVEYRCTGGKYREKECPARLYLLYQSLTTRVSLYSTDCEHDHYEVSDSGRGLSEELKLLIRNLFEDGITKPNSILAAIKRQNEAEPPKSKIVSFLRQLRNKKYEQSILPDWDGEDPLGNL